MVRKQLPIGIQNFREIREADCYYVDKTAFALKLAQEGKYFSFPGLAALANPCFWIPWVNFSPVLNPYFVASPFITAGTGLDIIPSFGSALVAG